MELVVRLFLIYLFSIILLSPWLCFCLQPIHCELLSLYLCLCCCFPVALCNVLFLCLFYLSENKAWNYKEKCISDVHSYSTRSVCSFKWYVLSFGTNKGQRTFKFKAAHLWNSLPENLRCCTNVASFKHFRLVDHAALCCFVWHGSSLSLWCFLFKHNLKMYFMDCVLIQFRLLPIMYYIKFNRFHHVYYDT